MNLFATYLGLLVVAVAAIDHAESHVRSRKSERLVELHDELIIPEEAKQDQHKEDHKDDDIGRNLHKRIVYHHRRRRRRYRHGRKRRKYDQRRRTCYPTKTYTSGGGCDCECCMVQDRRLKYTLPFQCHCGSCNAAEKEEDVEDEYEEEAEEEINCIYQGNNAHRLVHLRIRKDYHYFRY